MKAVVMAGGEGTRLRPPTSNQPKPMVPIVGKPCMEHIIEPLKAHGFEDVIVTVAFLPQSIRSYFETARASSPRPSTTWSRSRRPAPRDRCDCERLSRRHVHRHHPATPCDFDPTILVEFHKEKGPAATIALKSVENPLVE